MDTKKAASTGSAVRPAARTPQPPPPLNTAGNGSTTSSTTPKSRSRSSTPMASTSSVSSPAASAVAGSRPNGQARHPPRAGSNNNNSPRVGGSVRKPVGDEPATDNDNRSVESPHDEWLRQSEATLATMEKQVHDAAKKNLKHQSRCTTMRNAIAGKEDRMDALQGTYATLGRALDDLVLLSTGDLDVDALEELYRSIPSDERTLTTE